MATDPVHETLSGVAGDLVVTTWSGPDPRYVVVLAHGYGEHLGRYQHVAETLVGHGAVVTGPDHVGHGRSAGERVLISSVDDVVADLHQVLERAVDRHPGLPVVLVGHSMGGLIGARYAQLHADRLAGLVLSGPVLGSWRPVTDLLDLPEMPDEPLDVATLSRDPAVGEAYGADELVWHGPFRRPTVQALADALDAVAAGPPLGDLPTLWVHGADDQLVPLAGTRPGVEALRATRLEETVYPGARHEVFNETNRDEVLARVTDFVDRVTAGR